MAYCRREDLLLEMTEADLAKLTGDPAGQTIDYDRVDNAITNALILINAYLYDRYPVPFVDPVDPLIRKIAIDFTVANLFEYAYSRTMMPQTIVYRRLNAFRLLKDVQSGMVSLMYAVHGTDAPPAIISNKDKSDVLFPDELLEIFGD